MRVLCVNTGSSSVKLALIGPDDAQLGEHEAASPGTDVDATALGAALAELGPADAVAHRIVHGGRRPGPARLDAALVAELEGLTPLAPLHQPKALAAIAATERARPGLPAVACFDTAFHAGLPAAAATYALPAAWRERFGLRRFGFHGLSHAYASRRAVELLGLGEDARLVTCHLGAGASLAAIAGGASVDTTMGFTPLEGIVMATRSGSVDPGLVLHLVRQGLAPADVLEGLERESGLKGLAGTGDTRELLERDDDDARLALAVYVHRRRRRACARDPRRRGRAAGAARRRARRRRERARGRRRRDRRGRRGRAERRRRRPRGRRDGAPGARGARLTPGLKVASRRYDGMEVAAGD